MNERTLDHIESWFNGYVASFRADTPGGQRNYDLKREHTTRVRGFMNRLSASLGMTVQERSLAAAIAICHDVGRFPQYRDFGTFSDAASTNHAALAVKTLDDERVLDGLDEQSRGVLVRAICLHNVFTLPDGLDPVSRRFALLIRDADKLDIWRVLIEYCCSKPEERASAVVLGLPESGACSVAALDEVAAGRMLHRSLLQSADDFKLLQLSWAYDLNFDESFRIMDEKGYIGTLAGLLPDQPGCREAVDSVVAFVRRRIGGDTAAADATRR
jgi:hypothetical protein